eukprot:CAMPEP_0117437842 /NCGR_PEP_ID=MMETSP0759-20121206/1739_1 /TAXON_ID=63605 /ORGANISM="Percolomonas cosmopolitus, Strain WS" /LENGTH=1048 /DNA_ID=CAMNT_0005229501 /DNA_START=140 /DNA_END=3283 /DNA_ORIENTATION=-
MSPPQITNQQELATVLKELLTPSNNQARKIAEKSLSRFSKNTQSLAGFLTIIKEHPDAGLRQLAAVIGKNKIADLWKKVDSQKKEFIKSELIKIAMNEQVRMVRISISQFIGAIAQFEIPNDSWKELAPFLHSCVKSENVAQRELGFTLFAGLLETSSEYVLVLFDYMIQFFQAGLQDADEKVRSATVKAVSALLVAIRTDDQFKKYLTLVEPLVKNLQVYVNRNDSSAEAVDDTFDILTEFIGLEYPEVENTLPPLINFMVEIMRNNQLEIEFRDRAATLLGFVVKFRPNLVIKLKMVESLINVIFSLLVEPEDDDLVEEEMTAFKFASSLLDELAVDIPSKYTFKTIVENSMNLVQSQNPFERKAGIAAIGIASEGCNELMKANIGQFIPIVVKMSEDQHQQVREATVSAVVNFVEYLIPDVSVYHTDIIPLVMKGLDDPHEHVKEKTCFALDALCNTLKAHQLSTCLKIIMQKLLYLLQNSPRNLQKVVLTAIGSVARAAKLAFQPYFDSVINIMKQVMTSTDEANLGLRARATEATGIIAEAVGVQIFGPHVEFFMNLALENFNLPDGHELGEYSFHFFAHVANILKVQFKPFLDTVVSAILAVIKKPDGQYANGENYLFGEEEDGEDEEDLAFNGNYALNVHTSLIDEKGAAILALGTVAAAVGVEFNPYFQPSLELLSSYVEHFHYHIRRQIMIALKSVICSVIPKPVQVPLPDQDMQQIVDTLMELYIARMYEDDDAETVARVCESIAAMCKDIGRIAVQTHLGQLNAAIITLLRKEGECNSTQLEEEEDADHDIVLIDAVSDLIDEVARCVGPPFVAQFKEIFPELVKYVDHNAIDDRVMAVGTLAEVSKAIGKESDPFVDQIFRIALHSASESHFNVKRNALFCLGVLSQNSPHKAGPHLMNIIQLAIPVMQQKQELDAGLVDNACGCIARLVFYHTDKVPLQQILPIYLQTLPLREDFQENDPVYASIFKLIESQNPHAANNIHQILRVFAESLGNMDVSDQIQQKVVDVLKQLNQQVGKDQMMAVVAKLDAGHSEKI